MENTARYATIGAFATLAVAAMFAFVYWFSLADQAGAPKPYDIVFKGSVTGLTKGGDVLFNGIKVGQVENLRIDPDDPKNVIARVKVDNTTPVKTDTKARLEFQGLTGIGFVQLAGGSADAQNLAHDGVGDVPQIFADKSDFQNLLDGVKDTIGQASGALARLDGFLADNENKLATTLDNVEKFSGALAANSDGLNDFLASLADAGTKIGPLATELQGLSQDVREIVKAVPPQKIADTVENVASLTGNLRTGVNDAVGQITGTLGRFEALLTANEPKLSQTLANAEKFSGALAENSDGVKTFMSSLTKLGDQIGPLATELEGLSKDVRGLVQAIPPEQVASTVASMSKFSDTLGRNSDRVDTFFKETTDLATNLKGLSEGLQSTLGVVSDLSDAVDPKKIETSVANLQKFTDALGNNAGGIDEISRNATETAAKLNAAASRIDGVIDKVEAMVTSGEGEGMFSEFTDTARAIRVLAEKLDTRTAEITSGLAKFSNKGLRDYATLAGDAQKTLRRLERLISDIDRNPGRLLFGGEKVREYKRQ